MNINSRPDALAEISGSPEFPDISGTVKFYHNSQGVIIYAVVNGLPKDKSFFGFHIHSGSECTGDMKDPFSNAMAHYNPNNSEHPHHAGDLPPLLGNDGLAISIFLTNRFSVDEVIGKVIIIHSNPDDFTTQPSGNSGEKIACGIIRRMCCKCKKKL